MLKSEAGHYKIIHKEVRMGSYEEYEDRQEKRMERVEKFFFHAGEIIPAAIGFAMVAIGAALGMSYLVHRFGAANTVGLIFLGIAVLALSSFLDWLDRRAERKKPRKERPELEPEQQNLDSYY